MQVCQMYLDIGGMRDKGKSLSAIKRELIAERRWDGAHRAVLKTVFEMSQMPTAQLGASCLTMSDSSFPSNIEK
jgi:hypothetical protein